MRWGWLCVLAIGCGRVSFDPLVRADATSAGDASSVPVDAALRCDPTAEFGAPTQAAGLNNPTMIDAGFRALPNELVGYFYSFRSGNADIYVATRASTADAFTVSPLVEVNTASFEGHLSTTADGLTAVFASDRAGGPGQRDLWLATRNDIADVFTVVGAIPVVNSASNEYEPLFRSGSNELYFTSNRTGDDAIYVSTFSGTTFAAPTLVLGVDTAGASDGDPVVSVDGLSIVFRSDRPGSAGGTDIWTASRASTATAFGSLTRAAALSSAVNDGPNWMAPDGCSLYMTSAREGNNDVLVATKPL